MTDADTPTSELLHDVARNLREIADRCEAEADAIFDANVALDMDHAGQEQAMSDNRQWTKEPQGDTWQWLSAVGSEGQRLRPQLTLPGAHGKDIAHRWLEYRDGDTSCKLPPLPNSPAIPDSSTPTTEDGERWKPWTVSHVSDTHGMDFVHFRGEVAGMAPSYAVQVCAAGNALLAEIARLRGENERLVKELEKINHCAHHDIETTCYGPDEYTRLCRHCRIDVTEVPDLNSQPSTPGPAKGDGDGLTELLDVIVGIVYGMTMMPPKCSEQIKGKASRMASLFADFVARTSANDGGGR